VDQLVAENVVNLRIWIEGFRPVKGKLLAALAAVYRDRKRERTAERSLATNILQNYVADPGMLADLLMDADEKQFAILYPKLEDRRELAAKPLLAELDKRLKPRWTDLPLNPAWKQPDAGVIPKLEAAHGVLAERFAFCQTMPLQDFLNVADGLRQCGYRPVRFRPYARAGGVASAPRDSPGANATELAGELLVAAVWTRDSEAWQLAHGLSAEEIRQRNAQLGKQSFQPVDVAGYLGGGTLRYAALWVQASTRARLEVELSESKLLATDAACFKDGYRHAVHSRILAADGATYSAGIWIEAPGPGEPLAHYFVGVEGNYSGERFLGDCQVDVQISKAPAPLRVPAEFLPLLSAAGVERRYTALWHPSPLWTSTEVHGLDPADHLARCNSLLAQGYRPASISAIEIEAGKPLVTASVWQRPLVAEGDKEQLAKRQAAAAIALLRLGRADSVWPLLRHSPDPRVRTYLIHRLSPMGADVRTVIKRLEEEKELRAPGFAALSGSVW
jgi:hypothetical protein